ncbi:hypothetical protein D3C81_2299630 [compost metagenome]
MEVINHMTKAANNLRYIVNAGLNQVGRINRKPYRALLDLVKENVKIIAVHDRIIMMMMQ